MAEKRWILRDQNQEIAKELASGLGIHPLVAQILLNRGITTKEEGDAFLNCELHKTPDPFLMKGMAEAVERIQQAFQRGENIVVYGDYDADGQTATALLVTAFREAAPNPELINYYLPDRLDEGYGLHKEALMSLAKKFSLLVTVDCGISAVEEVGYAKTLGLDIIITDHHEPGSKLPEAVAILNPKQPQCPYPFKELAGVGVALKLIQGLGVTTWPQYLDLVTLGTVADLVPLRDENRTLVRHGLQYLAKTTNLGVKALLEVANVKNNPTAGDVGFRLGPRLNAAGRLGDPSRGVRLFLTTDQIEALSLARELDGENSERQELETQVLEEAVTIVEKYGLNKRPAIVVWGEGWHQGVIGIVASRLVDRYYLPTVVISLEGDGGIASARSISGLDLYQTLAACGDLLTRYGGHTMAAGLSLPIQNLLLFQKAFEKLCANTLTPEEYIPKITIDAVTSVGAVTEDLIKELACLEPHGIGNPGPTLQANVTVTDTMAMGQENKHLRLRVRDETGELGAVAFGIGSEQSAIDQSAENLKIAFVPKINEWRDERNLQLQVQAWQKGTMQGDYVDLWMLEHYPWKLPVPYFTSKALQQDGASLPSSAIETLDFRGTFDKIHTLTEKGDRNQRTLILVNTPTEVLELCRLLRIQIPGSREFIGFEHEWLSQREREEFQLGNKNWIVSTGYGLIGTSWPSVWLWHPPLNENNYLVWRNLVEPGGTLISVYGPRDVRSRLLYLQKACPNRGVLAQIYARLRESTRSISLDEAHGRLEALRLLPALPVAIQIFQELGLWDIEADSIIYKSAPAQKLDLNQTVLYNKVTLMYKESSDYLKRCLERGFCQDGLKREN